MLLNSQRLPLHGIPSLRGWFSTATLHDLVEGLESARALRSWKNRAVSRADTFSATAVATNWLMLVPSCLLNRTTASLSDRGGRPFGVLQHPILNPLTRPCGPPSPPKKL